MKQESDIILKLRGVESKWQKSQLGEVPDMDCSGQRRLEADGHRCLPASKWLNTHEDGYDDGGFFLCCAEEDYLQALW